jgi:cytochrome c553
MATGIGSAELGKMKAPSCVFCHTVNSVDTQEHYPILNGQDKSYLFNAMQAYKKGDRIGPLAEMMRAQLQNLNEDDMRDVAAFYSELSK